VISAAAAATKPVITFKADDMIDSHRPSAALTRWTDAPGRRVVTLSVPGATLRGYTYGGRSPKAPVLLFFGGNGYPIALDERDYRL
jgi:hypothetical protein